MEKRVAEGLGHTRVDLGNDVFGVGCRGFDDINGYAQGTQAVYIGRRYGDKSNVERYSARFEFSGDFRQEDWGIIADTLLKCLTDIVGDKKGVHLEFIAVFFVGVWRRAYSQQVHNVNVVDIRGVLN